MNREPVIDVHGLTKVFDGRTVVNGVDLTVRRGEIFGFLGPNGSGKTTFIRMVCGLLKPDGGSGTALGLDILTQSQRIKPQVGYMAQRFSLYEDLTVRENLEFMARVYGVDDVARRVQETVERMGLDPYVNHLAGALSGGWKQRLALGACTQHRPRLLLLDEPTAGVDPGARRDFWDEVHQLAGEGITALISTHYMDEAERCHRLAYIAYGDLLAQGTRKELIDKVALTTYSVRAVPEDADRVYALRRTLSRAPGVDQVVAVGAMLNVSGRDAEVLARTAALHQDGFVWEPTETSLEMVFIDLMRGAQNGSQGGGHA